METPNTLDDIRAVKGVFPADEIEPGDSVLDLMCAGFYGANAAIHVIDRDPKAYSGVDIDGPKIEVMRSLYPADEFEFMHMDAERVASCGIFRAAVVICDPWTQGIPLWMERLRFLNLCGRKRIILGTCASWLEAHNAEPTPASMNEWRKRETHVNRECTRVIRRSDHLGGTFWTVWR